MVIGHFGAAFTGKRFAPQVSLGTFVMATIWLDLLWPFFLLVGLEHVKIVPGLTKMVPFDFDYPYSHSLAAALAWGLLFGAAHFALRRSWLAAVILALCVISHWALDFVVHRPDLPLSVFTDQKFGLGLWNYPLVTLAVEGVIFAIGLALYWTFTKAVDKRGLWALIGFVVLLLAIYSTQLLNVAPPSEGVIAYVGLAQWLLVAFGYWIDRHRVAKLHSQPTRG